MFQQKAGFRHGIFIDNLNALFDESILQIKLSKLNIEGITNIKVPRNHTSKASRGYSFVGFESQDSAIKARESLNFKSIMKETSEVRVSLIIDPNQNAPENALIVSGLPETFDNIKFDEFISKYGVVASSKIQYKNDGVTSKGFGYVQFLRTEDAVNFMNKCEKQEVEVEGKKITAVVFKKRQESQNQELKNIYLKDYKQATYTQKQLDDAEFKQNEQQKINDYLKETLKTHGNITSVNTQFSKQFQKPFAFVCFETTEAAQNAVEAIQKDSEFHFDHVNIQQAQRQKERDPKCIYMKNLKKNVTEAQIEQVLTKDVEVGGVRSVCIRSHPDYPKTNYAIVFLKESEKLSFLKNALNIEQYKKQALIDLFDSKPYIGASFPKKQHLEFLKRQHIRNMYPSINNNYQGRSMPGFPTSMPGMPGMPGMIPMMPPMYGMMPPMGVPPMGMGMQMAPPMQNLPPGMVPVQNFQQNQMRNYQNQNRMQPNFQQQNMQRPQNNNRNYNNQRPQHHQSAPQQGYQNNRQGGQKQYQNRNQQQQQQKPQAQQANKGGKQPAKYQPKQVQPKPIGVAGKAPVKPAQAAQPGQLTIQSLEAKWADFQKIPQQQQTQMLGTILLPQVQNISKQPQNVGKIVGMLVDLNNFTIEEVRDLIKDQKQIYERVREAEELFTQSQQQ